MYRWVFKKTDMVRGYIINKVPEIISQYYLQAAKKLQGVPKKIKADEGTEHSLIELYTYIYAALIMIQVMH